MDIPRSAATIDDASIGSPLIVSCRSQVGSGRSLAEFMREIYLPLLTKFQKEQTPFADFCFGNPHDPPIPAFARILHEQASQGLAEDCPASLFQYQFRFDAEREAVLKSLQRRRGPAYEASVVDDVFITNGAFGGLLMVLQSFTDAGDQLVIPSPDYFMYEGMIHALGCSQIFVRLDESTNFDLNVAAIQEAFMDNPRARVLILTCPNNPSGKMYTRERFQELAHALQQVNLVRSQQQLPPVVILSDEAYHRIIFPSTNRPFVSPAEEYPWTISVYSYGKTCMAPSERLGWVTLGPLWPNDGAGDNDGDPNSKASVRATLGRARMSMGLLVPSYTNARCIPQLEEGDGVCVDMEVLQRRRDKLVGALMSTNSPFPTTIVPESGFYLLVKIPPKCSDDEELCKLLGNKYRMLVMPMSMTSQLSGWLRFSLTANDDMVDLALQSLKQFVQEYERGELELESFSS